MRKLLLLFSLALFVNCSAIKDQKSQTKADGLVTIKIVQVNDVYEIDALNDGLYGGMARVAYIRDSIQKQNPNTYLFMGGDFLNPSLLGNIKVDGKRLQGKQMVDVMNAMDFDLVRSEERRVGKECRSRWSAYDEKKKMRSEVIGERIKMIVM